MAQIAPFEAIRFNHERIGTDLSDRLAPPYDVLNQRDKDLLLKRSNRNIVAIDLPHIPPKSLGPAEQYQRSASLLSDWLADGTLVRETQPAIYVYHQRFDHLGRSHTRRMFIACAKLHAFSDGVILPHEHTFGGPKEDRLALMRATRCNLSPVFGLYGDADNRIAKVCRQVTGGEPDVTGALDEVENLLWIVTDRAVIKDVLTTMADKQIYIADGHHRYITALNYRDGVVAEQGGAIPKDHPANFVMLVLASMDDPGCLILPYHRALSGISLAAVLDAWSPATEPAPAGEADLLLFDGETETEKPVRYSDRSTLERLAPNECEPWHQLDAAYLHRYLIDELLAGRLGRAPKVHYLKSADVAKRVAREQSGVALLVNATPMAHLRAVSEAGGLMPQKSTYFHPKLATGLAINPLTPDFPGAMF